MSNRWIAPLWVSCLLPALAFGGTPGPEARPWGPLPGEAFALHDVAVSPEGATLCVGYRGDLWLVPREGGLARRLTDHVGHDSGPAWSRDGHWIAFSSRRDGNFDVFLVPAEGGPATQLTFHAVDEWVTGFTPDGREVLFVSARDNQFAELWAIPVEGGMPRRLTRDRVADGRLSPDGRTLAYTRGGGGSWRQGYRGSSNAELWLASMSGGQAPVASGAPVRVTRNDVHDRWPQWTADGESLIYVSERSGIANLWRQRVAGGQAGAAESGTAEPGTAEALTDYADVGVEYPALSSDGRVLAFVRGGFLWSMDLGGAGSEPKRVVVEARSEDKVSQRERLTVKDGAAELVLAPDGKRVAFVLHGDLFTHPTEPDDEGDEETRRHTESPVHDHMPAFGPGPDELVFVSDHGGKQDLWIADLTQEGDLAPRRIADTPEEEFEPRVSPDGKWILYTAGHEDLMVRPASGGKARLLVKGPQNYTPRWSPDSRWIAYERHDASDMGDIWVVAVAGDKGKPAAAEPLNLTKDPAHDQMPFWSPDGMSLGYESDRDGDWDLWTLSLVDDDVRKARKKAAEREKEKKDKKGGNGEKEKEGGEKNGKKPAVEPIEFDPERDYEPQHLVDLGGEQAEAAFSPDSERLIFLSNTLGNWDIWVADDEGKDSEALTDDDARELGLAWLPDGEKFVYVSEGRIKTLGPDGGDPTALEFAARMTVDHGAERLAAFDEAWRLIRHHFYDEKLHGVDWPAVKDRYRPSVEHAATREELHSAIRRMLGELKASHLGVWGPDEPGGVETGYLGLELETVETKGERHLRVSDVLPKGPTDEDDARVEIGEFLVAIDGKSVRDRMSVDPLLDGKVDKKVRLTLSKRAGGKTRDVKVKAVKRDDFVDKVYERWVEERKQMVKELSDGRVGYIHVRAMDQESLRKFRQGIIADVFEREALVLDVRDNGGGNIHEALLEVLEGRRYIVSQPRGGERRQAPAMGWYRPILLLINEYSGSDAEIFPHGFKALELGKVIGVPTAGAVIGTGQATLIDGSTFRLPRVGWYSLDGKNLENWGIEPDIRVEQEPADRAQGVDTQLARAVAELMAEIGDGKPAEGASASAGAESR